MAAPSPVGEDEPDAQLASFTIEPPVLDFGGLVKLYGWRHARTSTKAELHAFLDQRGAPPANTLLEFVLDPVKPVTASRHF